MSHFAEPVIPDELRFAERDPESSECAMTSFDVWFPAFAGTLSGSRLASSPDGLGRDDELRYSLLRGEGTCSYSAETKQTFIFYFSRRGDLTVAKLRLKKRPGGSASFFPAGRFGEMFSKCMPLIVSQRRLGRGQSSNGHPER